MSLAGLFRNIYFDPASIGLYPIISWSPNRILRREDLNIQVIQGRPRQSWCDLAEWQLLANRFRQEGKAGDTAFLVGFEVNQDKARVGRAFRYTVTHCSYWEHLATVEYLRLHDAMRCKIREAMQRGQVLEFTRSALPAAVKINVAVISREGDILAIQRSAEVQQKKGLWTTGPNETMTLRPLPGSHGEDMFELAERALQEELSLEPVDYGNLIISWMGYDVTTAQAKIYAQVRSRLTRREIECKMAGSQDAFEAQAIAWLSMKRRVVADVIENWQTGDAEGRFWSASAPHSLKEIWRFRRCQYLNRLG